MMEANNSRFGIRLPMCIIIPALIGICSTSPLQTNTTMEVKDSLDDIKNNMVSLINCYRSCHSSNPLTRDTGIETSQSNGWAEHLASSGSFQHSNSKYGENLYGGSVSSSGQQPVNMWYFECEGKYVYDSENNDFGCGHFTALVWKSSKYIGIGIADSSSYGKIVVANFNPAGNMMGDYSENVPRPDSTCVQSCKSGGSSSSPVVTTDSSNNNGNGDGSGDSSNEATTETEWDYYYGTGGEEMTNANNSGTEGPWYEYQSRGLF